MKKILKRAGIFLLMVCPMTAGAISITLTRGSGLTDSQWGYFGTAQTFWEGYLTGYKESGIPSLEITATGSAIDGAGGILGSAGPTSGGTVGSYFYAVAGEMDFDTADLSDMESGGTLLDVIKHEMAHVIGFGTLWTSAHNNVYTNGTGQYTGANALAQYKAEFDSSATYVPVEQGGGSGTADGHWDEADGGTNPAGDDFGYALMSGWLNSPTVLTNTTLGSFEDIGYNVSYIPEPKMPPTLAILGVLWFASRRRRARIRNI